MKGVLFCVLLLFAATYSAPSKLHYGMKYLVKYGYMDESEMERATPKMKVVRKSLKTFQKRYNIKPTGKFDKTTMKMMGKPRCGKLDIISNYTTGDSKWEKSNLTFKIINHPDYLNKSDVIRDMKRAFALWSLHIPLSFQQTESDTADVKISFESHAPDDDLAYAYFPTKGEIHFNTDYIWSMDTKKDHSFLSTATHEIGHVLGLEHSDKGDESVVMYPYETQFREDFDLAEEDVSRIKKLYG